MDFSEAVPLVVTQDGSTEAENAAQTCRKLDRRVLLLCTGVVFINYVDRSNIGYAAKDLCTDLSLTHEEYGVGVSLFYAGYLATQVIGNILLRRLGAPRWFFIMMFSWGSVAVAMGFMQTTTQFYILRIFLGIAEGGTFPAVWYYLALFYPSHHITGAYSVVYSAISFSMPLSSPISAGIFSLAPFFDVEGWRLLFVVEGLTPIVFSFILYICLPESPEAASFLQPAERAWIVAELKKQDGVSGRTFWGEAKIVLSSVPWWLVTVCVLLGFGISNIIMFWATLIIHHMLHGDDDDDSKTCGSKDGNAAISILLTSIPYLLSGLACLCIKGRQIRNRSKWSFWIKFLGGVTLISWVGTREVGFVLGFLSLCFSIGAGYVSTALLVGLVLSFFDNATRSTASSLFNMISSLGAVVFPPLIGMMMDAYGYGMAILFSGGILVLASLLILFVKDPLTTTQEKEHFLMTELEVNHA